MFRKDEVPYTQRRPYEEHATTQIQYLALSSEMPDVTRLRKNIEETTNQMIDAFQETDPTLAGTLRTCLSLLDNYKVHEGYEQIAAIGNHLTEEDTIKIHQFLGEHQIDFPDIFSKKLKSSTSNVLIDKMLELNLANIRQIAKKGSDLYDKGFRVKEKHLVTKGGEKSEEAIDLDNPSMKVRIDASIKVFDELFDPKYIEDLYNVSLTNRKSGSIDPHIYVTRPVKDYFDASNNCNFLTMVYIKMLVKKLNEHHTAVTHETDPVFLETPLMQLTTTSRTDASAYARILKQPAFDLGSDDLTDKNYLLCDDHVNAGGFFSTLYAAVKERGVHVTALTAFTTHPHVVDIKISDELKEAIKHELGEHLSDFNETLNKVGLSVETLSVREGLTVLAILLDNDYDNTIKFNRLHEDAKKAQVLDGKDDSLITLFLDPAVKKDVGGLITLMNEDIQRGIRNESGSLGRVAEPVKLSEPVLEVSEKVKPHFPSEIGVRQNKVTGPRIAEALRKMSQENPQQALKSAERFLAWKKYHHRNFNVQGINELIRELKKPPKSEQVKPKETLVDSFKKMKGELQTIVRQDELLDTSMSKKDMNSTF